MQLHSSGRNVSGVACRTLVICLTSLRWTVSEICASLRICPTVGSCFEGMASSVCRFNGDDASLKMYVEGCGARADAPSIYGCTERGGRLRPKYRGCTCHEILPNFGNQTVILELILTYASLSFRVNISTRFVCGWRPIVQAPVLIFAFPVPQI